MAGEPAATHPVPSKTWMEILTQPHNPSKDICPLLGSMTYRSVGWGLSHPHLLAKRIVYDANFFTKLTDPLFGFLSTSPVPDGAVRAAETWAQYPYTDSTRGGERCRALCEAACDTVKAILDCQLKVDVPVGLQTNTWGELGSSQQSFVCGGKTVVILESGSAVFMERYAEGLLSIARKGAEVPWTYKGDNTPEAYLVHLAVSMSISECRWKFVTSHTRTIALRLIPATEFSEALIVCSPILTVATAHLILPALVSTILSELRRATPSFPYPLISRSDLIDVIAEQELKSEPEGDFRPRICSGSATYLETMDLELGFGKFGTTAHECYVLKRTVDPPPTGYACSGTMNKFVEIDTTISMVNNPNARKPSNPAKENSSNSPENKPVAFVLITSRIGYGSCGEVYYGTFGSHQLAIKISSAGYGKEYLTTEYDSYRKLREKNLTGTAVPVCFGLFEMQNHTVLVTAFSGKAVYSFKLLSVEERLSIYCAYKSIEDVGIHQGSFAPRNVVCDDNGVFRIIDFHRGTSHGRSKHDHLNEARYALQLESYHTVPLPCRQDDDGL